jgi:catechol 2,3-dioxygenase-like lactoylglutathione lyase family enzyme
MLHHISFAVTDVLRSSDFYDAVLAPLGFVRVWTHEITAGFKEAAVGYGLPGNDDEFAIRLRCQGCVVPGDGLPPSFSTLTATGLRQSSTKWSREARPESVAGTSKAP